MHFRRTRSPISPRCKGRRRVACFPYSVGTQPGCGKPTSCSTETSPSVAPTDACLAPSLSIWGAASMAASTSLSTQPPTSGGFAATCSILSRSLVRRSSSIPAETSAPLTIGKTASVLSGSGRGASTLAFDRTQRVRDERVYRLVPSRRRRADARRQPRHAETAGCRVLRRILQPSGRHHVVGAPQDAWPGQAA